MARVRAGDQAAFERLFDRYAPGLLSFCRHMLGSREEAEDAVQHVFLAAHRTLVDGTRDLHLRAWLFAVARNRCLSMLRARREHTAIDDVDPLRVSTAGLSAEVERRQDLRDLVADVQRLPDDQRAALVLAELGAHTHDDIAEILEVRRDKVKALVFQARESLAGARRARELPCEEVRAELATVRGAALRRGHLRRHCEACAGCREFRAEVSRQRAGMAVILPVLPTLALKSAILGGGAGSAVAGGAVLAAKGAATKLLTAAAVAGSAGGGYVAVHELRDGRGAGGAPPPTQVAEREAGGPAQPAAATPAPGGEPPRPAMSAPGRGPGQPASGAKAGFRSAGKPQSSRSMAGDRPSQRAAAPTTPPGPAAHAPGQQPGARAPGPPPHANANADADPAARPDTGPPAHSQAGGRPAVSEPTVAPERPAPAPAAREHAPGQAKERAAPVDELAPGRDDVPPPGRAKRGDD